jgi:hypothetical protein
MKLFARGREHLLYDSNSMTFLWPFDAPESPVLHGLATLSYHAGATTSYRVEAIGAGALGGTRVSEGLGTEAVQGALTFSNVWRSSSPSLMHASFHSNWSLMFWAKLNRLATSSTFALMEYGYGPTPSAIDQLNKLGVYTDQGTRRLAVQWDLRVSPALTTQFVHTPVTIGWGDHFALVREDDRLHVWKNGYLSYTASSLHGPDTNAASGNSSNWSLGGSYRYGLSTTTAALVSGITAGENISLDDVGFFPRAITPGKIRETYANGVRPWDEELLLRSGQYRVLHRVLVKDGNTDADWIDMSSYRGRDWTMTASVTEDVESDWKKAKIRLRRRFGRFLDLSRTNTESSTYDGSQQLIDLRTRIRIEYALVPVSWEVQGWEWAPKFDGFVDSLDWGDDALEIEACDRAAALGDTFRVDARRYEYGQASTTLSSGHLQNLINDNVPKTIRSGQAAGFDTWGYLGGTPVIYTPVTDQWVQRYEHGGTGTVLKLLQGVADQIGWDVRYRDYPPLAEDRLTYFEPPRNLSQTLSRVEETADGFTVVTFPHPHGLQLGQAVELSDIPNFSTTGFVKQIPTWNKIVVDREPAGTPSAETSGNVEHGAHFTLRASNIFDVGRVSMNIEDIRNHVVIKYNREGSAATFYISAMEEDGADLLFVYLPEDVDVSVLEAGQEVTIESPDAGFSGTRAISFLTGNSVELVPAGGVLTGTNNSSTSGLFYSEYLAFNQVVVTNTPSIGRYGLRSAGVFEGSIEGVDTKREALQLARGMLSDMANPTVDMDASVTCLPHVELHDLLALEADPLGRWTAMNVAVVGYTHNFGPIATTDLQLRHDHPSKGRAWLNRGRGLSLDTPGNWGIPNRNIDIDLDIDPGFNFDLNPDIGPYFMSTWTPMGGKRSWLHDRTEVHFSTSTSGFAAQPSTLVDSTRGAFSAAAGSAAARFSPGTTYFVKYRHRDRWGNLSGTHSGSTAGYTMRFLTKTAGAKTTLPSTNTVAFTDGRWNVIWGVTTATGGYDPYNNFTSFAPQPGGPTPTTSSNTASYFTMPCNGVVNVEGRVGLRCIDKSTQQISVGLFIRNSVKPGSGTDRPFLYPKLSLEGVPSTTQLVPHPGFDNYVYPGFLMGSDTHTVNYARNFDYGVALATVAYVTFSESISANSGDQILLAVRPDGSGNNFMLHPTDGTTTACTGWIRYTLLYQDPEATGS